MWGFFVCFFFQTEYEGQIKKYISVIDEGDTDAIVVAGGDGSLIEVRYTGCRTVRGCADFRDSRARFREKKFTSADKKFR
jgi:hypothetical protein